MKKLKKIGLLTGGGDCPGLNAVIRAVVHTAISEYGIKVLGIKDGYAGLVNKKVQPLELKDVSGILPRGGTILGTSNRDNPFKFPQKNLNGEIEFKDHSKKAVKTIEYNEIDGLITVGGDGTQAIANMFNEKYQIPIVGVPKTIDNDLGGTDVTFGFDTALNIATSAIDKLHSTAESHHRTMIIEVMGRYAGWIALEAGIAGGGDVILIPEIPFTIDNIIKKIENRQKKGKRFSLVVVAEGAKEKGKEVFIKRKVKDPNDPIRLGGISNYIGLQIEEKTGIETRHTILGHLQRGGSPSPFDRILASRFGFHAVKALVEGKSGHMVGLRGENIKTTLIKKAISKPRNVHPDCDMVKTARALGTSFGD